MASNNVVLVDDVLRNIFAFCDGATLTKLMLLLLMETGKLPFSSPNRSDNSSSSSSSNNDNENEDNTHDDDNVNNVSSFSSSSSLIVAVLESVILERYQQFDLTAAPSFVPRTSSTSATSWSSSSSSSSSYSFVPKTRQHWFEILALLTYMEEEEQQQHKAKQRRRKRKFFNCHPDYIATTPPPTTPTNDYWPVWFGSFTLDLSMDSQQEQRTVQALLVTPVYCCFRRRHRHCFSKPSSSSHCLSENFSANWNEICGSSCWSETCARWKYSMDGAVAANKVSSSNSNFNSHCKYNRNCNRGSVLLRPEHYNVAPLPPFCILRGSSDQDNESLRQFARRLRQRNEVARVVVPVGIVTGGGGAVTATAPDNDNAAAAAAAGRSSGSTEEELSLPILFLSRSQTLLRWKQSRLPIPPLIQTLSSERQMDHQNDEDIHNNDDKEDEDEDDNDDDEVLVFMGRSIETKGKYMPYHPEQDMKDFLTLFESWHELCQTQEPKKGE